MHALDELESFLSAYLNFEQLPQKNMFWLDTMESLCAHFDHPERFSRAVHVAGSKGKGSVSAMIQGILSATGARCGLYTSPHVSHISERVTLGNELFDESVYKTAFEELQEGLRNVSILRQVTWFELMTLYSFLVFRQAKCEWVVYETGLGGRLDATNVVIPCVSVITIIEREHTEYLGDTLEAIAGEKAGIIKQGVPVITAQQIPSVRAVFEQTAHEKNAPFESIDTIVTLDSYTAEKRGCTVCFSSPLFSRPIKARLRLYGEFQAENAALASVAAKTILPSVSEDAIERGLSCAFLSARFEVIEKPAKFSGIPYLVIDGAHTPKSVMNTVKTFNALFASPDAQVIFSCAGDKNVKAIARLFTGFENIMLTLPGSVKKTNPELLQTAFDEAGLVYEYNGDYACAISQALLHASAAGKNALVTGSFYLAGEVKKAL